MKKLTAEDVADLGIGTIVGWDTQIATVRGRGVSNTPKPQCFSEGTFKDRDCSRTGSLVDFWRGQVKKLTAEDFADLGIGTIVGCQTARP